MPVKKTVSHKGIVRIGSAILGAMFGFLPVVILTRSESPVRPGIALLAYCGVSLAVYFASVWLLIDHREKIESEPLDSKELRRRRKEFFSNLPK
jgi:hypothetical protein